MSAKLEHLSIEKAALENRNNILEKVLVMRDQELGKIKAEDQSLTAQVHHLPSSSRLKHNHTDAAPFILATCFLVSD